ncbi:methylglyoxal reductase (NADPH-dependent) gre2 [Thoreauomyces humboldtii]|nr:methylglyoxal reductase (NADPH-dependent) gre2 [Thoreauomyces humboldtii]
MSAAIPANALVLVTGITGFVGSHVAEVFLQKGYRVRGTLRTVSKADSLKARWNANGYAGRFEFVIVADLLNEKAFHEAVIGVDAIAHVASPVTFTAADPYKDVIDPAVQGTLSVLKAAKLSPSVKRIVITSSVVAMFQQVAGHTYTEADWNDWASPMVKAQGKEASGLITYLASKVEAERAAWKFVEDEKPSFTVVTIAPSYIWGPPINEPKTADGAGLTVQILYSFIDGTTKTLQPSPSYNAFVDVREVAQAHLEAVLRPKANGRYLLCAGTASWPEIADTIHELYPDRPIPAPSAEPDAPVKDVVYGARAIEELGIEYRSLRTTMKDMLDEMIRTVEA